MNGKILLLKVHENTDSPPIIEKMIVEVEKIVSVSCIDSLEDNSNCCNMIIRKEIPNTTVSYGFAEVHVSLTVHEDIVKVITKIKDA